MTTKVRPNIQLAINLVRWPLLVAAIIFTLTGLVTLGFHLAELFAPQAASAQVEVEPPTLPILETPTATATLMSVAIIEATPEPTPMPSTPTSVPARPRLVTGESAVNVRRGPGLAYEKIALLPPKTEAIVTGWSSAWWQINLNGEAGFVFGDIVTAFDVAGLPEVPAPPLPDPTPTVEATPVPDPVPVWAIDESRWIDVDLSDQTLIAYEGMNPVKQYLVSTGLPQTPTPIGQYRIWIKLKTDDMAGADYYIKDVPWVMYFFEGYGLHGVTWHANFGHPMSHGCVNQPNDMAEWLFHFANVGTLVNIHE